jgi:N-acyl-D-aspartate/D-glutamate deacylase
MVDLVIMTVASSMEAESTRGAATTVLDVGNIIAVGQASDGRRQEVGAVITVSPGFVDHHSRYNTQVIWESATVPSRLSASSSTGTGPVDVWPSSNGQPL